MKKYYYLNKYEQIEINQTESDGYIYFFGNGYNNVKTNVAGTYVFANEQSSLEFTEPNIVYSSLILNSGLNKIAIYGQVYNFPLEKEDLNLNMSISMCPLSFSFIKEYFDHINVNCLDIKRYNKKQLLYLKNKVIKETDPKTNREFLIKVSDYGYSHEYLSG